MYKCQASGSRVVTTANSMEAHHSQCVGTLPYALMEVHYRLARCSSPKVGEHTREILTDAGFSETQIDEFTSLSAIEAHYLSHIALSKRDDGAHLEAMVQISEKISGREP